MKVFFSRDGTLRRDIVSACLDKLQLIRKWFEKQKQFAFFASSVLIAYEGMPDEPDSEQNTQNGNKSSGASDTQANDKNAKDVKQATTKDNKEGSDNDTKTPAAEVRMIDFAHVFPATAVDENYSFGLASLINYLTRLIQEEK